MVEKGPYYSLNLKGFGVSPTERELRDLYKTFSEMIDGKLVGEMVYLEEPITDVQRDELAERIRAQTGWPVEILGMTTPAAGG